ncbi:DNA repair protein RecO [Chryseobacterium koreense]|uniref:DNA repair protein RecO n=1 Tax=Chryseobacterium koreense TaxID=232216 RepID=UPI0026F006DB|nr:recombination protein O N-terminal domain-containing protein [Chryseobacterium koreense]
MQDQKCFLLSYIKYGDNDAVLHCFSQEFGFESFFARGIYAPRNKKKPYLIPLILLNISIIPANKSGKIPNISKLEPAEEHEEKGNLVQNTILFFVAEFLNQVLREERQSETIFHEITVVRKETLAGNINAYNAFLVKFLQISGIAPLLSDQQFLHPESGTFGLEEIHELFDEKLSQIWRHFLAAPNPYEISLKRTDRNLFTDSLMRYYQIHFSGFRIPKSLEIMRQVYE